MRFLLDQNIPQSVVAELTKAGHDAAHVRDYGLQRADDQVVLDRARGEDRMLVSADTDFGELLARSGEASPSVLLFRPSRGRGSTSLHVLILGNIETIASAAEAGSVVVVTRDRLRIRQLPLRATT